jgi:hypothetical protein
VPENEFDEGFGTKVLGTHWKEARVEETEFVLFSGLVQ